LQLRCKEGPRQGEEFVIESEGTIGRSIDASVALPSDSFASSLHARIVVSSDGAYVQDLGSTNGTRVNHELIRTPTRVGVNDTISVGKSVFQVVAL
jgi:pSer/pThr/pTyr-binding forkhead associated (FHA) protein